MENRFRVLKVFSVVFKVLSFATLVVMGIGIVGVVMGRKSLPPNVSPVQIIMSQLIGLSVSSLICYTFGEISRILRVIEERTRKS